MNSSVYFLSKVREKYSDDHCAKIADLFIPFHYVKTLRKYGYDDILCYYPLYHNILSQIPCTVYNYYLNCKENKNYKMSQEDLKSDILKYAFRSQNLNQTYHHNKNIIFILVESFDSWTMSDTTEVNIMPNLKRFVNENNVFYCKNVIAQQIHGMSGDGQMIINTGLLPIKEGVACMKYPSNVYPCFAHCYPNCLIVNSSLVSWNQPYTTISYGYQKQIGSYSDDDSIFVKLNSTLDTAMSPFCAMTITVSMHAPFTKGEENKLNISEKYSENMRKYANAANYTDSKFPVFLDYFMKNDELKSNTIVVITGDHNSHTIDNKNCPLIIWSSDFTKSEILNEEFYQMDIFPTILHFAGIDNYWWNGFGVNLSDSTARNGRVISPEDAVDISDKIIRSNALKDLTQKL